MDHNKLWEILKEMGIPDHLTCFLRNLYAGQEATVRPDMEQWTGSKLGKENIKVVYYQPTYSSYMQSASCKMPIWMKHKLESRLPGETSIASDTQMIPPLWQKADEVVWYSHLLENFPQFVVIHTVRGFSVDNEAEVDVFLELSFLFYD